MQRNLLTAAILVGVGGGAFVYTWVTKIRTADERFKNEQNEKRLFQFGLNDVTSGQLFSKTATFSFERDALVKWRITEPMKWPADIEAIDAMIQRMSGIIIARDIADDANEKDLEDTGLNKPVVTLSLKTKDAEHSLYVGAKNALNGGYPVSNADKKRIGLSDPSFYWALERNLSEFRSKRLFHDDPSTVRAVRLRDADGKLRYEIRAQADGYQLKGVGVAKGAAADRKETQALLSSLAKLFLAERFVTDTYTETDAGDYGLTTPAAFLDIEVETATRSFVFGKAAGASVMVHPVGSSVVAEIDERFEKELGRGAGDYQDRTLSRYTPTDVVRIQFAIGKDKVSLTRGTAGWKFDEGTAKPKVWKVDRIIEVFAMMRASGRIKREVSDSQLREYLLEPPSRRLTMYGADTKVIADVRIGKYHDKGELFAQRGGDATVFLLQDGKLSVLPGNVKELETK